MLHFLLCLWLPLWSSENVLDDCDGKIYGDGDVDDYVVFNGDGGGGGGDGSVHVYSSGDTGGDGAAAGNGYGYSSLDGRRGGVFGTELIHSVR